MRDGVDRQFAGFYTRRDRIGRGGAWGSDA
jgi:hypothetical protein